MTPLIYLDALYEGNVRKNGDIVRPRNSESHALRYTKFISIPLVLFLFAALYRREKTKR